MIGKMLMTIFIFCGSALFSVGTFAKEVDVELILAVDVSNSVDEHEYDLMRNAMADAFESPEFVDVLDRLLIGRIAVNVLQWSTGSRHPNGHQNTPSGWFLIGSESDAREFAAILRNLTRPHDNGTTNINHALRDSLRVFETSPYKGMRRVIDISGDGQQTSFKMSSSAASLAAARREVLDAGITINALPVGNKYEYGYSLHDWYPKYVIGGLGAFSQPAESWDDYAFAFRRKLIIEVADLLR